MVATTDSEIVDKKIEARDFSKRYEKRNQRNTQIYIETTSKQLKKLISLNCKQAVRSLYRNGERISLPLLGADDNRRGTMSPLELQEKSEMTLDGVNN